MSTKRNDKSERLPLMDELNELIEKERTLLSLKLLAQQNETETWKSKYDTLIDKVGNVSTGASDSGTRVLEAAAEIEDSAQAEPIKFEDVQRILINRTSSWSLDLSGVCLDKVLLGKVSKEVFGPRGSFDAINSVYLAQCNLTDEFILPVLSMIRSPRLQAIDLSRNEFSDVLFLQLLTTLQDRRTTPQYVLLEDNPPMTATVKHFEALLDVLTEQTWGMTASLKDFASPGEAAPHVSAKKAAAAARKEPNYDYKETAKPPMVAYEFLRAFNTKLDPSSPGTNARGTKAAKVAAKKAAVAAVKGAALGRLNGLHSMSAFGLTHCHLSKRTVELLDTTLHCISPTLTDLDLSYAYIGYPGAEMLRDVLGDAGCQLVRLGLAGNAIGDAGLTTMSQGLLVNNTLTYLDLRSNHIGDSGLAALVPAVHRDGTVLDLLDLHSNPIRQEAALLLTRRLDTQGSTLRVRFDAIASVTAVTPATVTSVLYSHPHQTKTVGVVNKPTKLHSIDLSKVYANHADKAGQVVELRWAWRPVPLGTHDTTGALLYTSASSTTKSDAAVQLHGRDSKAARSKSASTAHERDQKASTVSSVADNAAYFKTGSSYMAGWEVRVLLNNHDVSTHQAHAMPSSGVTRSLLDHTADWVSCCVLLSNLPFKGTVDLYAVCTDPTADPMDNVGTGSKTKQFVGYEVSAVQMAVPSLSSPGHSVSTSSSLHPAGGDGKEFSGESISSIAKMGLEARELHALYPPSKGMSLLRKFKWSHRDSEASLIFDSKLISASGDDETGSAAAATTSSSLPVNHHTLGYVWAVYVLGAEGSARVAAEGMCVGAEGDGEEENNQNNQNNNQSNQTSVLLKAWRWRSHQARLSGLHCDDVVVLAAKVISEQPSYPAALLAKCAVNAAHCVFLSEAGSKAGAVGESAIDALYHPHSVDDSSAFAEHDVCNVMLPM